MFVKQVKMKAFALDGFEFPRKISNFLYFLLQDEAALEVHPFIPLIKIECSPDLKVIN